MDMDASVKALARLGLTNLDLPRLNCDSDKRSSPHALALDAAAASRVAGAASSSSDSVEVGSEDGSQDSLAVEVDAEVPSSMSSMDDDDEYDVEDDFLRRQTDDSEAATPTGNRVFPTTKKTRHSSASRKISSPTIRFRRLPSAISPHDHESSHSPPRSTPVTPTRHRPHHVVGRRRVRTISASEASSGYSSFSSSGSSAALTCDVPGTSAKTPAVIHNWCNRTIYTAGRPPWYNEEGLMEQAFVIGICGASASGKTTVAKNIIAALDVPWVSLVSMDSFYKVLTAEEKAEAEKNNYNFDHPDAFDTPLLVETLTKLKAGKRVEIPIYNFKTHSRDEKNKVNIYGANVVIFEGIMAFAHKSVLDLMDMKIFVDTDSDIRLARRLQRDILERGRDIRGVLQQYERFVKPSVENFIDPSMMHADIIIPRGGENKVAIHLVVQHVHTQLQKRDHSFRSKICTTNAKNQPLPQSFHVMENTPSVKSLHTIIRNHRTNRDEFIFYSKRLMRLLVEHALSFLPYEDVQVTTPQGTRYDGSQADNHSLCGVSILRAGEVMEPALASVCKDVRLGKILIQTNPGTGEPELHYLRLPKNINDCHVFLMEATVASGAAAMMAIRVLLDHDVPEERIVLLSLLMASPGIQSIAYAFPNVRMVTTAYDSEINEDFHIIPGIGNFGDRYFGTDDAFEHEVDEW